MSTMKVDSIVSSGGTNTAQINGITPALASQAEAEAGTDNTKLMTPLRVAQAITAQTYVFLGSVSTTSGTSRTISGLDLTPYRFLLIEIIDVSHNAAVSNAIQIGTVAITAGSSSSAALFNGNAVIVLSRGYEWQGAGAGVSSTGVTNASTSVTFTWNNGASFDAGSIELYGVL